jgi:hypothetical protein
LRHEAGREPVSEAAIVKDLSTLWEQELQRVRRQHLPNDTETYGGFEKVLQFSTASRRS